KVAENYYGMSPAAYKNSMPLDNLEAGHYKAVPKIVEPVGLQVLDELLFLQDKPDGDKVYKLTKEVRDSYQVVVTAIKKRAFYYDFEVLEACRLEVVRIMARGITGFDTPGSLNAMEEAACSLQGIEKALQPLLSKANKELRNEIEQLFEKSLFVLKKSKSFENFDRLTFIKNYINPLYSKLYEMQMALGIKTDAEMKSYTPSWNAYSDNIFSEDFLNPYYYSLLKKEDDSEELRRLGEQLFYDTRLSKNGKMSCATCHKPELVFTDGYKTSMASMVGKNVLRNSPTLINSVYADRY